MTASKLAARMSGLVLVLAVSLGLSAAGITGRWSGAVQLPGTELRVEVDLAQDGEGWKGDITIPQQNASDLPLSGVAFSGETVTFTIAGVPGDPTFRGALSPDGTQITGDFTQGGQKFPFKLERKEAMAQADVTRLEALTPLIEGALKDFEVPGLAVAIVRNGSVVLARGYGYRDVEKKLPVTAETLFPIGSSTKAFTTFVMGTLVDEGKLDWQTPVRRYLPGFALGDPYLAANMTPVDLVTHRSGFPRHDLVWYNNQDLTRPQLVERLGHLSPSAGLREKFQYNNLMYLTAGHLIEQLTGLTWEEAVRQRIFQPLGMSRSNFVDAESEKTTDFAWPYRAEKHVIKRIPFREVGNMGPAGSINSSVNEMTRWMQLHLEGGKVDGKQLIQRATLTQLHTPQMVIQALPDKPETGPATYAMGWFVDTYRGHLRIHHGGNIDGFSALVTLFPHDGTGIVVLTNGNGNPLPSLVTRHLFDTIEGLEPKEWIAEALVRRKQGEAVQAEADTKKETVRVTGTKLSHPIADYAGAYAHPGYGTLRIARKGDALSMTYNGITAPLAHWHYDVFRAGRDADPTFEDAMLQFVADVSGNIAAVQVPAEVTLDPMVFEKQPDEAMTDPTTLQRFVGDYVLGPQTITVTLQGTTLVTSVPGQPAYQLRPALGGWFELVGLNGFRVRFESDTAGRVTSAVMAQPNGVFTAKRK